MRITEFWRRMEGQFGVGYATSVARDQVIHELGGMTIEAAFRSGEEPKAVWRAVCVHFEIPARDR